MSDPHQEDPQSTSSHWDSLASELGADTSNAVDPEQPSREHAEQPEAPTTQRTAPTKPKPKREPPARNHWHSLLGRLGITTASAGPPPEEPEDEPEEDELEQDLPNVEDPAQGAVADVTNLAEFTADSVPAPGADPHVAPENPAPASSFGANIFEDRDPTEQEATEPVASGSPVLPGFEVREPEPETDGPAAKEAWEALGFEFKSKPEERPPRDDIEDMTLEGAAEDAFADSYWDADSTSDVVMEGEEDEVRFTPTSKSRTEEPRDESSRPRRSRRGGRRRNGRGRGRDSNGEGREARNESDQESPEECSGPSPTAEGGSKDRDEQRSGRGRRGGRRRGRRSEEGETIDEAERRLEESADLFDQEPQESAEDAATDSESGEATPREGGRPAHRRIPSWQEAVGVLVDTNLANRGRRESNGPKRGGRRGRGRRPDKRSSRQ